MAFILNVEQMRLSIELETLIKQASPLAQTTSSDSAPRATLSEHLEGIDARKALEVEHFLRACAIRLDLCDRLSGY